MASFGHLSKKEDSVIKNIVWTDISKDKKIVFQLISGAKIRE